MKKFILICIIVFVSAGMVFGITADELYGRATQKYLTGDVEGAEADLSRCLELNPQHDKAQQLLEEITKELGRTKVPALVLTPETAPIEAAPKSQLAVKVETAHRLFLEGIDYFTRGDYLNARDRFLEVQKLLVGHEKSRKYLEEISSKLTPQKYDIVFLLLTVLLVAVGASAALFFIVVLVRQIYRWWRSKYNFCGECGARNTKEAEFCKRCKARLKAPALTEEQKTWFSKFGWTKNPFTLNILHHTFAGRQTEISLIVEKLNTLSGHILIIGGLGSGKTTLLQWLEKNLKDKFETVYVLRPPARPDELIDLISATLTGKTTHTRKYSIYEFQELCRKHGRKILLLLDEAHEFQEEFEQFLRTLGDLPNIFLIMAGLPQAREKLKRDLPALFDRIVESILLGSLTREETEELILKRVNDAGGKGLGPFTVAAVNKVHDLSCGIPRGILKICDWLVAQAVRNNKISIDDAEVESYVADLKLAKPRSTKEVGHE